MAVYPSTRAASTTRSQNRSASGSVATGSSGTRSHGCIVGRYFSSNACFVSTMGQ